MKTRKLTGDLLAREAARIEAESLAPIPALEAIIASGWKPQGVPAPIKAQVKRYYGRVPGRALADALGLTVCQLRHIHRGE